MRSGGGGDGDPGCGNGLKFDYTLICLTIYEVIQGDIHRSVLGPDRGLGQGVGGLIRA